MLDTIDSWKAWFSGGRTFSSHKHHWPNIPKEGCLGVVLKHGDKYSTIIHQFDWVYKEDGEFKSIISKGYDGTYVEAPEVKCGACLKKGVTVPDEEWEKVHQEMIEHGRS